jgi:hypothetical protein
MSQEISYYQGLITSEYQNSTNFKDFLTEMLTILDDVSSLADGLVVDFDLDLSTSSPLTGAIGDQLDILGEIIGQSREMVFEPTGGVSPILDDDTYRVLLKAKILENHWDGRLLSLNQAWQDLFPGGTIAVADNQNMTLDVIITGEFSSIIVDLITNGLIVPRPQGVLMTINFGSVPYFGFDINNSYIAGFDTGKWNT